MTSPLAGIRVLDLGSGSAAGIATMVLADFGADVIKVEPPGGDPARALANAPMWLRGKRSLVLDADRADDRTEIRRLGAAADVVVTTRLEDDAAIAGHAYNELASANPGLVYCRITGWGTRGPYAAYPADGALAAAKSGRMQFFAGLPGRDGPAYAAVDVAAHACSQAAVTSIVAALIERELSGAGQLIETSLLQALSLYDLLALPMAELGRRHPGLLGDDSLIARVTAPTLNYHPLPTSDGRWLQMGNLLQHLFDNFLIAAGLEDVLADDRYLGPQPGWRAEDREALRDRLLLHFKTRTARQWMAAFVAHGGVAATEYRTTQEAMDDPDLVENGHVAVHEHPRLGPVRQLGAVARLCKTPGNPGFPAHSAGEDQSIAATCWLDLPEPSRDNGEATASPSRGPLAGVTILEFATIIAAPLGVSILADLGARVIKVEPIGGDPYRQIGPLGIMAAKTNVSKESIAVDLKQPEGQAIVARLVERADALIHNYRPGVPERLGIGYEACRALRPEIVHVAVNGYGPDGPGARRPSTHPIPGAGVGGATLQAAGAHEWTGESCEELRAIAWRLYRANEANPDPNTSVVVATATALALLAQRRHGVGQQVFVDMFGANAYAQADDFIQYEGKPSRPSPDADLHGTSATRRLYRARDGWIFLSLAGEDEFERFCELAAPAIGRDQRFATSAHRREMDGELVDELQRLFLERPAAEWETALAPRGVGCVRADGPMPGEFWLDDPHVSENGFVAPVRHARFGDHLRWGPLAQFSRTPSPCGPGVLGGVHTRAILDELGYSGAEIDRFFDGQVVWAEPVSPIA